MNISSFTMLHTALSGVEAAQQELSTTGENIANESTADYEEQTVTTSASPSLTVTGSGTTYQLGAGVTVTKVVNTSDSYLDSAWRSQNSQTNSASTLETYTAQLNSAVGSVSSANGTSSNPISAALSSFWTDWSKLASNPSSSSAKQAVISAGTTLTDDLNSLANEISGSSSSSVITQAATQYNDLVAGPSTSNPAGGEVYDYASQIASLNTEIVQATAGGANSNANTLLDERNEYIDDLSALGNVRTETNADGSVNVYFGGVTSQALVSDPESSSSSSTSTTAAGDDFGAWSTAFSTQLSQATSASSAATTVGGTLGALLGLAGVDTANGTIATANTLNNSTTLSGTIGTVMSSLNTVANDLVSDVGQVGVLSSTSSSATLSAQNFFTTSDSSGSVTAANIAVSSTLSSNASLLWAGATSDDVSDTGDSSLATSEAENATSGTSNSSYDSFVSTVGRVAENAEDNSTTQSALSTQLTNQRDSVEGVDLDAEMTNLISEQQAYEASAKVMNTFNTIMDSLMSVVSG